MVDLQRDEVAVEPQAPDLGIPPSALSTFRIKVEPGTGKKVLASAPAGAYRQKALAMAMTLPLVVCQDCAWSE